MDTSEYETRILELEQRLADSYRTNERMYEVITAHRHRHPQNMVREFHYIFGVPGLESPGPLPHERYELRYALIKEELEEYLTAAAKYDVVEIADAIADLLYVVYGTAVEHGIDADKVVAEVHRSNMSKLGEDSKPIYREDGKVLKGPNYFKPDIAKVLREQGYNGQG